MALSKWTLKEMFKCISLYLQQQKISLNNSIIPPYNNIFERVDELI